MNLKELSRELGLSQTTVSRALNGYPEVSEATRLRVAAAAERYNYRPNTRARALATGRAMAIGHVIPVSTKHEMVNPIFSDFIAGAGETYSAAGYDILLKVVPDADQEQAYRDMAMRRAVDGFIIHGPRAGDRRIDLLRQVGLPFVVHGRASDETADYSWLDINNARSFERATRLLLDLGHRHIALINGLEQMDFARRRRNGFLSALELEEVPALPHLMAQGEMTEANGYRSAQAMLCSDVPPTAFLVSSYTLALGVRRAVEDGGLRLGQDVSLVMHDDELSYMGNPGDIPAYTATRSSVRAAGTRLAEMLLEMIATSDQTPRHELWETELTLGQSTGPCRG